MTSSPVLPLVVPDDKDTTARETNLFSKFKAKRPTGVHMPARRNSADSSTTTGMVHLAAHRSNTVTNLLNKKRWVTRGDESLVEIVGHLGNDLGTTFNLRAAQEIDHDSIAAGVSCDHGTPKLSLIRSISTSFANPFELRRTGVQKVLHVLRTSTQIGRVLKFSALFGCAFVLGSFSMESACLGDRYPDFTRRLPDPSLWKENVVLCLHLANGVVYTILALLCHVVGHRPRNLFEITRPSWNSARRFSLVCDLLTIPGLVAEFVHLSEKPAVAPTAAQWITLLQVAKFWRIVLPGQIVSASTGTFLTGAIGVFSSLAMFVHVLTVLLVFVANLEHSWGENSWVRTHFPEEGSCFVLYSEVLYFTALSVTSVGYGDLLTTPLERGLNTIFLLLSQLFTAKVCADLTWLTSLHNHWEAEQQAQQAQTSIALLHLQVPKTLSERVLAFQSFVFNVHRDESLDQPAFGGLSQNLKQELRLCAYRQLVLQAPFLREQPMKVIARIVSLLQDEIFLPSDFIVRCGDRGRELFFMRSGEAGVFATNDVPPIWGKSVEVKRYVAGDYFGELSMLTSKPRSAWIMAKTYLVVSKLQHHGIERIKDEFPEAFTAMVQSMVSSFGLTATTVWPDIAAAWRQKFGPGDDEDCFAWFCQQAPVDSNFSSSSDEEMEEELSAKAFEIGLKKLHIKEIDRMVLWADLDSDNSGYVNFDKFSTKMGLGEEWVGDEPQSPRSLAWVSPVRGFIMESARSSLPWGPSPRASMTSGQRQIEMDIQILSDKVAAIYNDMQCMANMLRSLATSEEA